MNIKRNIFANYMGTGVLALTPIFALPFYLSLLGPKLFGLLGYIATLQSVLILIDAGMSQALVREFSTKFEVKNTEKSNFDAAVLLFGFERVYWIFTISISIIALFLVNIITIHWFNLSDFPQNLGKQVVYGAVALFAVQFSGSVYKSLLVGAQHQIELNLILIFGAMTRHLGAVLLLLVWPTIAAYLIWHVVITFLETLIRAKYAWLTLGIKRNTISWDGALIKKTLAWVAGMSGATLLGALTVQIDKIILTSMVSVESFGYYTIASTLAMGLLQLLYPIVNVAIPYAISLRHDSTALKNFNFRYAKVVILIILIIGLFYFTLGDYILIKWLKNPYVASQVKTLLNFLLIGTALNVLYTIGYINWIVNKKLIKVLQVNFISLILSIVSIPMMVTRYGIIGASVGWIIINSVGLFLSLGWLFTSKQKQ